MKLQTQFSSAQLERINAQVMIYMCACPAQVSTEIANLRRLFDYQAECVARDAGDIQAKVHERIAEATAQAHGIMEECLRDILLLEGWDPQSLEMPPGMRAMLEQAIDGE